MDPDNKQASMSLLCKAFCIDGNCTEAHKADYKDNKEIAEALAQLQMLRDARAGLVDKDSLNFNIFSGSGRHCNKKVTGYTKCCSDSGWAKSFGASCDDQEKKLIEEANKGRCHYIDEYCSDKKLGVCIVKKKVYCCYPNVLSRVIQEGAKKQLGKDFGTPQNPQCQGFTIEEIGKIDFSKINMDEFFAREVMPNMKEYNAKDNQDIINRAFLNVKNQEEGKNEDLLRTSE
jgi:conjugal transfer mating pair stabilization protein TraN